MAKYFIFENSSKGLVALADTDEKKNNFLHLQTIYTAIQANDDDYLNVKNGLKKTVLSDNNTALTQNFDDNDFEYLNTNDLNNAKERIKTFIKNEIYGWEMKADANFNSIINSLNQIDVDTLSSVPTGSLVQWVFSQPGVTSSRPFEL